MLQQIGNRHSETEESEESAADWPTPHARPAGVRERAVLHDMLVATGPHDPEAPLGESPEPFHDALPAPPSPVTRENPPCQEVGGRERRLSFRYPVSGAHCILSWWEPVVIETIPEPVAASRRAESSIYAAVMARGPAFRDARAMRASSEARRERERNTSASAEANMQLRYSNGMVVDISQTGMAVLGDDVPRTDQMAWLRLERPHPTDWVEVSLKGVSTTDLGRKLIRLVFVQACPYEFFKAAVYGKTHG